MTLLRSSRLTWCVLRQTRINRLQLRACSSAPTSLYEKNGAWAPRLKVDDLLEIEKIWKPVLDEYDASRLQNKETKVGGKFYILSMFPYPSGKLHMGHVRVYTINDMLARYQRMSGHEVINPMGFDAFGLPAENAAIERGLHPKNWTYSNIEIMKNQMKNLCCGFDWEREQITCDPAYYKWTQFIFLKMFEKGLVYQREASVNWDPVDQTVLANEQIDEEGRSWRSGALAETRYLNQWYIRTTAYCKSLHDSLDTLRVDLWKEVIAKQKHWIGDYTGCRLDVTLKVGESSDVLAVFTEHPEAVYGVTHLALSPEHRYNQPQYHKQKIEGETSEILLNIEGVHPLTGESLPVVVSESSVTGCNDCKLGIPAVSDEDRAVADLHGLPWQPVYYGEGEEVVMVNSQQLDGKTKTEAADLVMDMAQEKGIGGFPVSEKLYDWLISRQRYWGTPIPVIHCDTCKAVPVPYEDLPVELPEIDDSSAEKGRTGLQHDEEWVNTTCPKCGGPARRETDTMDTFVDSSWYFLRYLDPSNEKEPFGKEPAKSLMPVDLYIGGIEHATLHLYYARFINQFLCDVGMATHLEPFTNLLTQGMVKAESYKVKKTGEYIPRDQVETVDGKKVQKGTGEKLVVRYEKMSKSKHNGVDPEELLSSYGSDLTRLCILSNVAPKSDRNWNNDLYIASVRWLNRVWSLVGVLVSHQVDPSNVTQEQIDLWDQKIKAVRNSYLMELNYHLNKSFLINAAISRLHELTTLLKKVPNDVALYSVQYRRAVQELITIIAPIVPLFSMECWSVLQSIGETAKFETGNVLQQPWPEVDGDASHYINVIMNGEAIGCIAVEPDIFNQLTEDNICQLAQQQDFYHEATEGRVVKSHYVNIHEHWSANIVFKVVDSDTNKDTCIDGTQELINEEQNKS